MFIKKETEPTVYEMAVNDLEKAKRTLRIAEDKFNLVVDDVEVDLAIQQLNIAQLELNLCIGRLKYLRNLEKINLDKKALEQINTEDFLKNTTILIQ